MLAERLTCHHVQMVLVEGWGSASHPQSGAAAIDRAEERVCLVEAGCAQHRCIVASLKFTYVVSNKPRSATNVTQCPRTICGASTALLCFAVQLCAIRQELGKRAW